MSHTSQNTKKSSEDAKGEEVEKDAKQKAADQPTRDDVHEQREPSQERPGVVHPS